jgi:hypothetical protein
MVTSVVEPASRQSLPLSARHALGNGNFVLAANRFQGHQGQDIETDQHGHILMSPPPAPLHGRRQSRINGLLQAPSPRGDRV